MLQNMGSERKARCPYFYVFAVASPMFNSNEFDGCGTMNAGVHRLNYELS